MQLRRRPAPLLALLLVVASLSSPPALGQEKKPETKPRSVVSISTGKPEGLPEANLLPFEAKRLADPIMFWVDYDWLRRQGVRVPPGGLADARFRGELYDAWAWQVPARDDPPSAFRRTLKRFYSTFYGGFGTSANLGDARAARAGRVDIKGIGQTPMLNSGDRYHSNGAAKTIEGIDEAIQAGILDAISPYGANRVVGVLFTGTFAKIGEHDHFGRGLIVRELSRRPAHFLHNIRIPEVKGEEFEKARLAEMHKALAETLPQPEGHVFTTPAEAIGSGTRELVRRWAAQIAAMVANRHYIGSSSPSNLEIDGKILDMGGATQVPGFSRLRRLRGEGGFGQNDSHLEVFEDIFESWNAELPSELKTRLPSFGEVRKVYEAEYWKWMRRYFVLMTGTPSGIGAALEGTPEHRALAELLLQVAFAGTDVEIWLDEANPNRATNHYDYAEVVQRLAALVDPSLAECNRALAEPMKRDPRLRARLAKAYADYSVLERKEAKLQGIAPDALRLFKREATRQRNKEMVGMVRSDERFRQQWAVERQALDTRDHRQVTAYVEKHVNANIRFHKDAGPYEIVLGEKVNAEQGIRLRRVFDAKRGEYVTKLRLHVAGGEGQFFGWSYSPEALLGAELAYVDASGLRRSARAERRGEYVDFDLRNTVDAKPTDLQLKEREGRVRKPRMGTLEDHSLPALEPPAASCVARALRAS